MKGKRGNPYEHRYREKVEETLTEKEYETYYNNCKDLERLRHEQRTNPQYPFDLRIVNFKISGLLAVLYYTGLRISEIVGDEKDGIHGLRKRDLRVEEEYIRVNAEEARKHGKREEPLWIPLDKLGVQDIVDQWEDTKDRNDRIFPISCWTGWSLISEVTEGRLYPHYFRLNRATKFAEHEETSIKDLQDWFGWVDPRTVGKYLGKAGKRTKRMAERIA